MAVFVNNYKDKDLNKYSIENIHWSIQVINKYILSYNSA